ncbi:hypothetical protein V8E53_006000 [Lactarius tabidus]
MHIFYPSDSDEPMNEPRLLLHSSATSVMGNKHVLKSNNTFWCKLIGNHGFLVGGRCKRQKMYDLQRPKVRVGEARRGERSKDKRTCERREVREKWGERVAPKGKASGGRGKWGGPSGRQELTGKRESRQENGGARGGLARRGGPRGSRSGAGRVGVRTVVGREKVRVKEGSGGRTRKSGRVGREDQAEVIGPRRRVGTRREANDAGWVARDPGQGVQARETESGEGNPLLSTVKGWEVIRASGRGKQVGGAWREGAWARRGNVVKPVK